VSKEELLEKIKEAVINVDDEEVERLTDEVINSGINMVEAVEDGYTAGIRGVGEEFGKGNVFLPELVFAAEMVKESISLLEEKMPGQKADKIGTFVMGTVAGDIHDIGKDLVITMLSTNGIDVIDIGVDCPVDEFIDVAIEKDADIIGASALLTMTIPELPKIVERMKERGVRDKFKFIVGGAAVSKEYAEKIGADGFGADLKEAVDVTMSLLTGK
jgi:trimethylamine corrinoid protein